MYRALRSILVSKGEGVTGNWKTCMIRKLVFCGSVPILGSLCLSGQDDQEIWTNGTDKSVRGFCRKI
jgi:hypothetical protein